MSDKQTVIGEVAVEVKAGLSVDQHTFHTCMNLAAIHGHNEGMNGMIVIFDDELDTGYAIVPLKTKEEIDNVMYAKFHCGDAKERENV